MKSKNRPNSADDTPLLPGIPTSQATWQPASHLAANFDHAGWWVKSSPVQLLNALGQPIGFKHSLMRGRDVVKTGIGADAYRTFLAQAIHANNSPAPASSDACDLHGDSTSPPTTILPARCPTEGPPHPGANTP